MSNFIDTLYAIIEDRKANPSAESYTNHLLNAGLDRITQKIGEEATEVIIAAHSQGNERLVEELADLTYHCLVLLAHKGLSPDDVGAELRQRHQPGPPASAEVFYQQGRARAAANDYAGAITGFDEAIRLKLAYVDAYIERGSARFHLEDFDGAIADLSAAIELDPDNADAYNNRGAIHHANDDFASAVADLSAALRLAPGDATIYNNRGAIRHKLGDLEGALCDLDEAIHLAPDFAAAYFFRSMVRGEMGDQAGSAADYREAARLNPAFGRGDADSN